jgi:HK97 family phage major capsid protein
LLQSIPTAEGSQDTLYRLPLVVTEKLPLLGNPGDICLLNCKHYLIGDRQQMAIAFSETPGFTTFQGTFRWIARIDGQPWMPKALTLSDSSNTVSPFVALTS